MICRLFEFLADSNLVKSDHLKVAVHSKDCDLCKRCTAEDLETRLCSNKYGWTIIRRVKFPSNMFSKGLLQGIEIAVKLVHPTQSSLWVCIVNKDDQKLYSVVMFNIIKQFDSLDGVNDFMKESLNYTSRLLTEDDINVN